MEGIVAAFLGACLCAALFGALTAKCMIEACRTAFRKNRAMEATGGDASLAKGALARGVPLLDGIVDHLISMSPVDRFVVAFQDALGAIGFSMGKNVVAQWLLVSGLFVALFAALFSGSAICAVALSCCLFLGVGLWSSQKRDRIRERTRESLPEAIQSMKACSHVGYSFEQTMREVARSTPAPLGLLFAESNGVLRMGGTIHESLAVFERDGVDPEVRFLAAALEIQHRTGSNMQGVLEATRQSVVDELELKRSLKTQTAQAKLSAQVVTVLPFALIGLFSLVSPGFLDPFFESVPGVVLLSVALVMQMAGIGLVKKMLKVEVS